MFINERRGRQQLQEVRGIGIRMTGYQREEWKQYWQDTRGKNGERLQSRANPSFAIPSESMVQSRED